MNVKRCLQGPGSEFISRAGAEGGGRTTSAQVNAGEEIQGPHWESHLKTNKTTDKKNSEKILIILSRDVLVQSCGIRQWVQTPTQIH